MNGYLLYSLTFFLFAITTVAYFTRTYWIPRVLPRQPPNFFPFNYIRYDPIPNDSFASDAAAGLHSSTFDLSANIESGDSRAGLDEQGKREVQRIMKSRSVTFDEARRQVVMDRFRREGIGPDGRPRDPKFVSFS